MTQSPLESLVLSFNDDHTQQGSASQSAEDRVTVLKQMISSSDNNLSCFIDLLRSSRVLRELTPLLIQDLLEVLIACDNTTLPIIVSIFDFLPKCLRPMEMYTFCMESWVNLHQRNCGHDGGHVGCRIALARSIVASMITDIITRTEKGSLARNRADYVMSFGLQLLSKYFNISPLHAHDEISNTRMVASFLRLVESLGSPSNLNTDKSVEFEVSIKLIASLVRFNTRVRLITDSHAISNLLFKLDPCILNLITTRLQMLQLDQSEFTNESGDYEILDIDIAALSLGVPQVLPLIWLPSMRFHYLLISSVYILNHYQDDPSLVRLAVFGGLNELGKFKCEPSTNLTQFLRLVIETSTSVGDETLLSLTERKSAYELVYNIMTTKFDQYEAIAVCFSIVSQSRIDACVGIFIKIAKDVETNIEGQESSFYKFARSIFEFTDVLNSTDSLKSILNWARLFYLSNKFARNTHEDSLVSSKLSKLSCEVDSEQANCEPDSIQQNRIIFLGHLVNRVKELI